MGANQGGKDAEPSHRHSLIAGELTLGLSPGRGEIWLWLTLLSAGGAGSKEIWWALLQKWAVGAVAEPRCLSRYTAQRCSHGCLAVSIQTEKQNHRAWPP